ncbi:uncharacterized protein B0P05DRAFT_570584 [Gilbertella persicaria]|uniref:uncharacterized protein n=1 Tax=Gilbertella persicaria TaxID=101096 RepID=UPI00221E7B68|nr:uncharacterized protein B0P05DRAFT_570584 [Gilbertella persicaria]KAI8083230.1 hypothetical protein B0P05DRAFT_570584 [Gilbertella persicaria]
MSQATDANLQELARTLSTAYHNVLQYSTLNEEQIIENLSQLSKYSNDLPVSWFTLQFLDTAIALKDRYFSQHLHLKGLGSIIILFSSWLRRYPTMSDRHFQMVMDTLLSLLLMTDNQYLPVQKDAWIGWVSLVGKTEDPKLLQGMSQVIERYAHINDHERNTTMAEALDAGVAHALARTNCLNDFEIESCQRLLNAYFQFASAHHGYYAVMTAIEHVVDIRSKEKPESRAEADLTTLIGMIKQTITKSQEKLACLAVSAGAVRMLQFNQGVKSKKVNDMLEEMEQAFISQLDQVIETKDSVKYQDDISFFAARCITQMSSKKLKKLDVLSLLKHLNNTLITSSHTFNNGNLIQKLSNTPTMTKEVQTLISQPLFKDIGRISRALAKLIEVASTKQHLEYVSFILNRLEGISYNIFFDWDRYIISTAEVSMTPEESKNYKDLENAVWTYFKSFAFANTVVLKAVAVDGQGLIQIPNAAQHTISIYSNLNFITQHLGEGAGRQAYQETLTNAVGYLLLEDHRCQLNRLLSLAFKEYAPSQFVYNDVHSIELLSMVKQSRLLFFTDLVEQVMKNVDDTVLENDILPVIYPVLKWKRIENRELYESAHTVVISAFLVEKPISRELAAVYAKILIDNFPEPMNLDQFRFGFTTLIQALCGMDDALAWLTTNQLIQKIDSIDSDIVLKNQYTTALIDLLKPLSLGPFFPSILDQLRRLILGQETKVMQKATMKLVFESVSGSGISDMRKTEAVGWFLELKRELKL